MKLSEVIAELEDGTTKTYEAVYDDGTRLTMSRDGGYIDFHVYNRAGQPCDQYLPSGNFNGNCKFELDWRPVKQSVKWDVAIKEWSLGKEVYCEIDQCLLSLSSEEFSITPRMISLGVWYVGD